MNRTGNNSTESTNSTAKTVRNGNNSPKSTVSNGNVTDISTARSKKAPKKLKAPDRTGAVDPTFLDPMLYALENVLIPKPSQPELKKYAKGGSNSTVKRALEIAVTKKWVEKKGQWRFTDKHLASKTKQA